MQLSSDNFADAFMLTPMKTSISKPLEAAPQMPAPFGSHSVSPVLTAQTYNPAEGEGFTKARPTGSQWATAMGMENSVAKQKLLAQADALRASLANEQKKGIWSKNPKKIAALQAQLAANVKQTAGMSGMLDDAKTFFATYKWPILGVSVLAVLFLTPLGRGIRKKIGLAAG